MILDDGIIPGWEGRTEGEWAAWMGSPALELHPELPSTNDRARALAREGALPFTAVVAGSQTAGRGRGGKEWISLPDSGLWMSILLSHGSSDGPGVLPLVVGVAAARALEEVTANHSPLRTAWVRVSVKWPNDLMISTGKVGGILCESSGARGPSRVVAGVGINLWRPQVILPPILEREAGFVDDLGAMLPVVQVARSLIRELQGLVQLPTEKIEGDLAREWRRRDYLEDRWVACEAGPEGQAAGVTPDGSLLVRTDGGEVVPVRTGGVRVTKAPGSEDEIPTAMPPMGGGES